MNTKTMEGLTGARVNISLANVPMRVFNEAKRKGDTAAMERAMGYANEFTGKAEEYKTKAEEGMKEDAKAAGEKEKSEREKMLEKRREEREKLQAGIEGTKAAELDTVEVSEDGKVLLKKMIKTDTVNSAKGESDTGKEPVIYTKTGEVNQLEQHFNISIGI